MQLLFFILNAKLYHALYLSINYNLVLHFICGECLNSKLPIPAATLKELNNIEHSQTFLTNFLNIKLMYKTMFKLYFVINCFF